MKHRKLRIAWFLAAVLVGLILLVAMFADVITPTDRTRGTMEAIAVRVEAYLQQSGQLPEALTDLPQRQGYQNRITDGWDRPFIYTRNDDGFSLKSLGKDGIDGGTGDDGDIARRYRVTNGEIDGVFP